GYSYLIGDYIAAMADPAAVKWMEKFKPYMTEADIAAVNRYTFITYAGLKIMAKAMEACGKDLTRACTVDNLRKIKNFDTQGLTA
ncbi:hypothetical protein ACI4CD_29360, partial [Klebsiella pneumoniae]|uniref:hypothetical protein n=1 Tax=Klebsiella pneumoniae TaxID=573 RepID=UPI003852E18C